MRCLARCAVLSLVLGLTASAAVAQTSVPPLLHYQGRLTDSGGNPLPSGPTALLFRITNAQQQPLFEEAHTVEVLEGRAAALIGNGTDPTSGAVHGGLEASLFTPGEERLLEVWANGEPVDDPVEIVSVPYALWSSQALRVAESGVDGSAIAPGSIAINHLAEGFVDELAQVMVSSEGFHSALGDIQGAGTVGVNSSFTYSGATTVQGVLEDLDRAITAREMKNVSRDGDTMTGRLTIAGGGIDVTGTSSVGGDLTVSGALSGPTMTTVQEELASHEADINSLQSTVENHTSAINVITAINSAQTTSINSLFATNDAQAVAIANVAATNVAQSNSINNLSTTVTNVEAAKVNRSGDTMTGDLHMSQARIRDVANPVDAQDVATMAYVLGAIGGDENPNIVKTLVQKDEDTTKIKVTGDTSTLNRTEYIVIKETPPSDGTPIPYVCYTGIKTDSQITGDIQAKCSIITRMGIGEHTNWQLTRQAVALIEITGSVGNIGPSGVIEFPYRIYRLN